MSLDSQTYALQFFPVRHYDTGEYTCLVNERRRPDTIIHLVVQGIKCYFIIDYILSLWEIACANLYI